MYHVLCLNQPGPPVAVLPVDCNPDDPDEGMLVYRSFKACMAAANHHKAMYDIDACPIELEVFQDCERP
jgi:hypothetical protein